MDSNDKKWQQQTGNRVLLLDTYFFVRNDDERSEDGRNGDFETLERGCGLDLILCQRTDEATPV